MEISSPRRQFELGSNISNLTIESQSISVNLNSTKPKRKRKRKRNTKRLYFDWDSSSFHAPSLAQYFISNRPRQPNWYSNASRWMHWYSTSTTIKSRWQNYRRLIIRIEYWRENRENAACKECKWRATKGIGKKVRNHHIIFSNIEKDK